MTKIVNYSTKFCLEGDCNSEQAEIKGYASVFDNVNFQGDIVARGAFTDFIASMKDAHITIPLVFEHETGKVENYIGTVDTISEDERGLYITASLADTPNAARVREMVENGTLNDFSVGIIATEYEPLEDGGDKITQASLREVSIVLTGADAQAKIEKDYSVEQKEEEMAEEQVEEIAENAKTEEAPEQDETSAEPVTEQDAEDNAAEADADTAETPEEEADEQADETEKDEEPADPETVENTADGETKDFSEETPEETEEQETKETETVEEKEYSMTKIETQEALPKALTAGGALLKQMKAEPKKDAYELRAYTAGNEDALKYEGAFQKLEDVVSVTGYTGVDYIDLFTVIDTDSNSLTLTKVDYEGKPAVTADAGLKAQIKATPTPISEVITKIAGYISISSACVEDGLASVIDADLAELLAIARNEYLVSTALDEAGEATVTGELWSDIVNNASVLRSKGAGELTLFVNPADTATLTKGNGLACCGSIADTLGAFGITRIEYTEAVDAGKFVLGDFKAQRVYRRTPIRVERATQSEDHFIYDIDDYRVYQRLGLFVRRPDLLVKAA